MGTGGRNPTTTMSENEQSARSPESTSPVEDAGADTQRRFRHQACYAAMLSLGLLEDNGPLEELYCEHHDDIVLRLKSGLFRAIQLKTRLVGGVPFKAGDDEVITSLHRFAMLEVSFRGRFEAYLLASNVGFWHERKNGSNLEHVLATCKKESDGLPIVRKISARKPFIDSTLVAAALRKVELTVTPGLDDVEARLREQLAMMANFRGRRYDELKEASETLRQQVLDASSLASLSALPEYVALCSNSVASARNQHIIDSKRISKAIVMEALTRGSSLPMLLRSHHVVPLTELPTGMRKMEIKMAAGGLSVSEIDHLKDLKFSAEHLLQGWLYKYGRQRAQELYEHLRVLIRDECLAAQQSSQQAAGLYGSNMLARLRERLQQRAEMQSAETLECGREHLMGMASILTEDCKVWWSAEFDLPRDSL
jgi:Cap4 dsDNA endonuclease